MTQHVKIFGGPEDGKEYALPDGETEFVVEQLVGNWWEPLIKKEEIKTIRYEYRKVAEGWFALKGES